MQIEEIREKCKRIFAMKFEDIKAPDVALLRVSCKRLLKYADRIEAELAGYRGTGLEPEEVGALLKRVSFCGSCKYFGDEDMGGHGSCRKFNMLVNGEEYRPDCWAWNQEDPSC